MDDVLAHEEHAERGDQRRQDDRGQVPGQPDLAIIMYSGMTPICIGTIMVPMHRPSSRLRPRKCSFAKANPASVQKATVPSVTAPETMSELIKPRFSGARSKAFLRLSKRLALGSSGGGAGGHLGVGVRRHHDRVVEREAPRRVSARGRQVDQPAPACIGLGLRARRVTSMRLRVRRASDQRG